MLHQTPFPFPFKRLPRRLNCMRRALRQLEKEASLRLGRGVQYVTWNCMGHAVRQFEKEVSLRLATAEELSN